MLSLRSRTSWTVCLTAIIALGIASRTVHSGFSIFDKYLGDALYAAMLYAILRIIFKGAAVVLPATLIMVAIELFQLTMIPAHLLMSEHAVVRSFARSMGTQFSFLDLVAYAFGIACLFMLDSRDR